MCSFPTIHKLVEISVEAKNYILFRKRTYKHSWWLKILLLFHFSHLRYRWHCWRKAREWIHIYRFRLPANNIPLIYFGNCGFAHDWNAFNQTSIWIEHFFHWLNRLLLVERFFSWFICLFRCGYESVSFVFIEVERPNVWNKTNEKRYWTQRIEKKTIMPINVVRLSFIILNILSTSF